MVSHYDLKEHVKFRAGEEVAHAIMLEFMASDSLEDMLDDFDSLKRGRISERVLGAGGDESINDPSRVPPGRGHAARDHLCALQNWPTAARRAGTRSARKWAIAACGTTSASSAI